MKFLLFNMISVFSAWYFLLVPHQVSTTALFVESCLDYVECLVFFLYTHCSACYAPMVQHGLWEKWCALGKFRCLVTFDKDLRTKWMNLIGPNWELEASIIVLQRIVTFFVKSKQQIIREKEGLKPNKNSVSLKTPWKI